MSSSGSEERCNREDNDNRGDEDNCGDKDNRGDRDNREDSKISRHTKKTKGCTRNFFFVIFVGLRVFAVVFVLAAAFL
jgi:hypothetical protein